METLVHTHSPGEITIGAFGDESLYSVCACGEHIELFGAYDEDRGVVMAKVWKVQKK